VWKEEWVRSKPVGDGEAREIRGTRETREARGTREAREIRGTREIRETRGTRRRRKSLPSNQLLTIAPNKSKASTRTTSTKDKPLMHFMSVASAFITKG
jgi:hypothetical protein